MAAEFRTPIALTIASSDSGGGAGIQADLKAFARCGVHGTSAIVALTAQNTLGVTAIHECPPEFVTAQLDALDGRSAAAGGENRHAVLRADHHRRGRRAGRDAGCRWCSIRS